MERQAALPGMQIEETFRRVYPLGQTAGQLTGYVTKITPENKDVYLERGYALDDIVKGFFLEKQEEHYLRGQRRTTPLAGCSRASARIVGGVDNAR